MLTWMLALGLALADPADRVLYEVADELVLASDLQIDRLVEPLDDSASPFWERPDADPVARLIDAAIVRHLAGDVTLYAPRDEEVTARLEAMKERFRDATDWRTFLATWGLDERAVRGVLRRRMVVERFLARNTRTDAANTEAWLAECDALLAEVRPRVRVRTIAAHPAGG